MQWYMKVLNRIFTKHAVLLVVKIIIKVDYFVMTQTLFQKEMNLSMQSMYGLRAACSFSHPGKASGM